MKIFTRHMIAMACVMMSALASADGYKGEAPPLHPVTIPNLKGGFELGLSVLYMTPTSSNLDYLGVNRILLDVPIDHSYRSNYEVNPNENWGFIFDLAFVFPNTAHDVRLDWMAFHSNYQNKHRVNGQTGAALDVVFFPLSSEIIFPGADFVKASAMMNYKLDALDLTFGQYINIHERVQTRMFAGLRYARVYSDLTTAYTANWDTDTLEPAAGSFNGDITSSFNGIGPMLGTNARFDIGKGLGLVGGVDIAVLAGQIGLSANQIIHEQIASTPIVFRNSLNWETQKVIAPVFDAKFGLSYQYDCCNGTQIIGELGYQISKYFDVIEQMDRDPLNVVFATMLHDGITTNNNFSTDVTNFGLSGGYFNLTVKI